MLLKRKMSVAMTVLFLAAGVSSCSSDENKAEEPVQPASTEEPAPPPADASAFSAQAIYFGFDDYTLNNDARKSLDAMGEHLKGKAGTVVQVEGHCDERGSVEYNLALGQRRAESVKSYLVQYGIDGARLTTISYGEEKPVSQGHDEAAWSKNRRAEFVVSAQ